MRLFVLAVLVIVGLVAVSAEGEGNLILQKSVRSDTPGLFALGNNFTVTLSVFNIGTGSAFDVAVSDEWNLEEFELVDGAMSKSWAEIPAEGSETFEFGLIPKVEGRFPGFRGAVEYNAEAGEDVEQQVGLSTGMGEMTIISQELYAKITDKHTVEWAGFFLAAAASVILPFLAYLDIEMNYTNGIPNKAKTA